MSDRHFGFSFVRFLDKFTESDRRYLGERLGGPTIEVVGKHDKFVKAIGRVAKCDRESRNAQCDRTFNEAPWNLELRSHHFLASNPLFTATISEKLILE